MNATYPLLPVSILTILAYFTTWLFSYWGIFSLKSHRKGWNYLLLITFLITGLLGLFSVIKINYNLEVKGYEQLLRWHVSFGIAMVVISLFHLSWHLKYYFSANGKRHEITIQNTTSPENNTSKAGYLLFLLGTITIINQTVFIREFIGILSGNELIIGVVMAFWLLLTGWGAYTARDHDINLLILKRGAIILSVTALLPVLLIGLLYWLKSQLFPPGTSIGVGISIPGIILLLFPICFLSGYLFVALTGIFSKGENKQQVSKAYSLESLGSLTGGVLFSLLLGRFFNSFQIIGITGAAVIILLAFLLKKDKSSRSWSLLALLIPTLIFLLNPDKMIKQLIFPNQKIVLNESTHYGNLMVTEQAGQFNFYENNELLFYTGNQIECEEAVHFAMLQQTNPKRVLLLSGAIAGMISEIEKYPVERITCLETNHELFDRLKDQVHFNSTDPKVEVIKKDIRTFMTSTNQLYDVILINLPPPSALAYNRFYTDEFFGLIKKHCNSESIVSASLPSTVNYAGENALKVNASLWKTIGNHFSNQQLLLGEKNYFLASDAPLSPMIATLVEKREIENNFVNRFYIDDTLQIQRSQTLLSQFDRTIAVNYDFQPFMFLNQINHWLSLWKINYWILVIVPILLFIVLLFRMNTITAGLYIGGFTSASLEIVLLIAYQLFFGTLYLKTSLFFALFMGGLAAGSYSKLREKETVTRKGFGLLQFMLALFALLIPLFIMAFSLLSHYRLLVQLLFFVLTFILAFGIGREYRMASLLQNSTPVKISGRIYSSDLMGSAFGAFLTAIVLFPVLGLTLTCIVVAVLNLISGNIAYFRQRI
jgi:spermidine synthase